MRFQVFCPPSLANVVDAIWDCSSSDADPAKPVMTKSSPGTSVFLVTQYRGPLRSDWQFGDRPE
jgi:hypothetical protein